MIIEIHVKVDFYGRIDLKSSNAIAQKSMRSSDLPQGVHEEPRGVQRHPQDVFRRQTLGIQIPTSAKLLLLVQTKRIVLGTANQTNHKKMDRMLAADRATIEAGRRLLRGPLSCPSHVPSTSPGAPCRVPSPSIWPWWLLREHFHIVLPRNK